MTIWKLLKQMSGRHDGTPSVLIFTVGTLLLCAHVLSNIHGSTHTTHHHNTVLSTSSSYVGPFFAETIRKKYVQHRTYSSVKYIFFFFFLMNIPWIQLQSGYASLGKPVPFLVKILIFLLHFEIKSSRGMTWNDPTHIYHTWKKHTAQCCSPSDSNPLKLWPLVDDLGTTPIMDIVNGNFARIYCTDTIIYMT